MVIQESEDVRLEKPLKEVWQQVLESLSKQLRQPSFESWIRPIHLLEINGNEASIGVTNTFIKDTIAKNYLSQINTALSEALNRKIETKIVVDSTLKSDTYTPTLASIVTTPNNMPAANNSVYARSVGTEQSASSSAKRVHNLNPKNTFDTFVVGSHNRFSHSAAMAVAANPGQAYNPLFIYGGVGLGKTHLMQAIGHQALANSPHLDVRYISCERFTNELINSIRDDRMGEFRKRYRQVDVLLMDDVQFIEGKESTQEEFFHTFNALRDSGRQIVLSSDRPPKGLSRLEERLRSRFEWGLISDIQSPDLETRMAILQKKCNQDTLQVPNDVLEYIASIFKSNIRELEGALLRAHAYANLTGSQITVSSVASVLEPGGASLPKKTTVTLQMIMELVASSYHLEPSELKSANRSQDLTLPRHIAMYLANEMLKMSFPRIGLAFGNRKHTSAIHAHKKIRELIANDPAIAQSVRKLSDQLSN